MRTIDDVLNRLRANGAETRLRAEFLEMPGLRLKPDQVQRLCGVERTMCQMVLDALVDEQFLCVRSDGHYARLTTGHHPHPGTAPYLTHTVTSASRHNHNLARQLTFQLTSHFPSSIEFLQCANEEALTTRTTSRGREGHST
jgi:hypothetical protein